MGMQMTFALKGRKIQHNKCITITVIAHISVSIFLYQHLNRRSTGCSCWSCDVRGDTPVLQSLLDRSRWPSGELPSGVHDCVRTATAGKSYSTTYYNSQTTSSIPITEKWAVCVAHLPVWVLMGISIRTSIQPPVCVGVLLRWCLITLRSDSGRGNQNTHSSQFRRLESK